MLALLDAIVWPALWFALIAASPFAQGVVGWTAMGLLGLAAIRRAYLAILRNERYWFTTAGWAAPIAILMATGLVIRLFS